MRINQDFQQQVLNTISGPCETYERAPFIPLDEVPAKKLYRYRLVTLPANTMSKATSEFSKSPVTLITRAEIDGVLPGQTQKHSGYLTIRAFNEYDFHSSKPWRVQIENQKGGLFATENRNNACKLGKWVAQALIAGSEQLRLGFVSRVSPNNNQLHEVLFVQPHLTEALASQIGMKPDTAWGQVRYFLDLIGALPDGNYILLKDPLKSIVRLYKLPPEEDDAEIEVQSEGFEELPKKTVGGSGMQQPTGAPPSTSASNPAAAVGVIPTGGNAGTEAN